MRTTFQAYENFNTPSDNKESEHLLARQVRCLDFPEKGMMDGWGARIVSYHLPEMFWCFVCPWHRSEKRVIDIMVVVVDEIPKRSKLE